MRHLLVQNVRGPRILSSDSVLEKNQIVKLQPVDWQPNVGNKVLLEQGLVSWVR